MFVALVAVMGVSIAGLMNFNSNAGAATQSYDYKDCVCMISLKNFEGKIITDQPIVTKISMQSGGMDCQDVCEFHYRGQEDRVSVKGVPASVYQMR